MLAEFNLGCDVERTQHVYRVYVATFLGLGGNMARRRYEDALLNGTLAAPGWVALRASSTPPHPTLPAPLTRLSNASGSLPLRWG